MMSLFNMIFIDMIFRYEREEAFCTIELGVTSGTLRESLELFVKGELLEGDNAYFCEKCNEKVSSFFFLFIGRRKQRDDFTRSFSTTQSFTALKLSRSSGAFEVGRRK